MGPVGERERLASNPTPAVGQFCFIAGLEAAKARFFYPKLMRLVSLEPVFFICHKIYDKIAFSWDMMVVK
jgi:hypothetical protein